MLLLFVLGAVLYFYTNAYILYLTEYLCTVVLFPVTKKQQSLSPPMDKIKFTSAVFYVTLSPFKELLLALVV